jgi:hypothetical protein
MLGISLSELCKWASKEAKKNFVFLHSEKIILQFNLKINKKI